MIDKQPINHQVKAFHGEYICCHPHWRQLFANILGNGNWQTWYEGELLAASSSIRC